MLCRAGDIHGLGSSIYRQAVKSILEFLASKTRARFSWLNREEIGKTQPIWISTTNAMR
jgi:hypothetical protein